jgi:hypothetical protein
MKNIWMKKKSKSKHVSLAQQNGFGRAAFWHTFLLRLTKPTIKPNTY